MIEHKDAYRVADPVGTYTVSPPIIDYVVVYNEPLLPIAYGF